MKPYTDFQPNYTYILDVMHNRKPKRLPLYEHIIDIPFIEKALGKEVILYGNSEQDYVQHYSEIIKFWKNMTYDAFSYEASICEILPGHGAIFGGMLGPIQTRDDFDKYPFDDIPKIFWETYTPHLEAIRNVLPEGMKAYGGCGNGVFETSQDLVGYESLCLMQYLDPELFKDLFIKIGDVFVKLWTQMTERYNDIFVFCRMGDDLGYKNSTLLEPDTIKFHIMPQYQKVIDIIHNSGKKFLLHSCGNIFDIMDDLIDLNINAKHSNEDCIAPFIKWINLYSDRIGLLGGIDVNTLCLNNYDEVFKEVFEKGSEFRSRAKGYGLGSGNSIAEYVPIEGFYAMIDAVNKIRRLDK
jgi:uroporphyrinogen decarboxylase